MPNREDERYRNLNKHPNNCNCAICTQGWTFIKDDPSRNVAPKRDNELAEIKKRVEESKKVEEPVKKSLLKIFARRLICPHDSSPITHVDRVFYDPESKRFRVHRCTHCKYEYVEEVSV